MSGKLERGRDRLLTDEQLVQAMAMGDQAAFEAIVHRYHGPLLGYVERLLKHHEKAEDFVQETFLRLIHQLQSGKPPHHVRAWLYRVAGNLCKDYWKSLRYRYESQSESIEEVEQQDRRPSVVEIYERQETRKEIMASLDELTETQRQIVILRFYQDFKLQEIAEVMDMTLSNTKTHLYGALRKLKSRFDGNKTASAGKKGANVHGK